MSKSTARYYYTIPIPSDATVNDVVWLRDGQRKTITAVNVLGVVFNKPFPLTLEWTGRTCFNDDAQWDAVGFCYHDGRKTNIGKAFQPDSAPHDIHSKMVELGARPVPISELAQFRMVENQSIKDLVTIMSEPAYRGIGNVASSLEDKAAVILKAIMENRVSNVAHYNEIPDYTQSAMREIAELKSIILALATQLNNTTGESN